MSEIKIRKINENDFDVIKKIVGEIWGMGYDALIEERYGKIQNISWQKITGEKVVETLKGFLPNVWVTELNNSVVGFLSCKFDKEKKVGEITYNGVSPEAKGNGIGTKQINFLIDKLKNEGMEILIVSTGLNEGHLPARRMYEKVGFKELSKSITYSMDI